MVSSPLCDFSDSERPLPIRRKFPFILSRIATHSPDKVALLETPRPDPCVVPSGRPDFAGGLYAQDHGLGPVCQVVGCLLCGSLGGTPVRPEYLDQFLDPSAFCLAQPLFQLVKYDLVGGLGLSIGLKVFYRGRDGLDAQVVVEGL